MEHQLRLKSSIIFYDAFNRVRRSEASNRAITTYDYDVAGNLIKVAVLGNSEQVTEYRYNGFGELIYENSPATGERTIYYDAAGNMIRTVNSLSHENKFHIRCV